MRVSLAVLLAVFATGCSADQFVIDDSGVPPGSDSGSDASAPPADAGADAPAVDAGPMCGGAPCAGTCAGNVCQLASMQDVRCLRVVEAGLGPSRTVTVFFVTKTGFGRVQGSGAGLLTRSGPTTPQARVYETCFLSSNQNSVYAADPTNGLVDSYSTALANGAIPPSTVLVSGQFGVRSVASALPWAFWNAGDTIQTCNLGAGCPMTPPIAAGGAVVKPNHVLIDGNQASGTVYFSTSANNLSEIRKVPAAGGSQDTIFLPTGGGVRSLIHSGGDIFFATGGTITKVDKAAAANQTTLATNRVEPGNLVVDLVHLYWTEGGSSGAIMRVLRAGAALTKVADADTPVALDVDTTHVYFAAKSGIYRAPKP